MDRALARTSDAPLRKGNHLSLLKNGPNTFDDWLEAISRAEHWVHLDNYAPVGDPIRVRNGASAVAEAQQYRERAQRAFAYSQTVLPPDLLAR